MRKFVIAVVATSAVVVMAGTANAREDYSNIDRQVVAREFRAQAYDTQQSSPRQLLNKPEHGPAYDEVGAP